MLKLLDGFRLESCLVQVKENTVELDTAVLVQGCLHLCRAEGQRFLLLPERNLQVLPEVDWKQFSILGDLA